MTSRIQAPGCPCLLVAALGSGQAPEEELGQAAGPGGRLSHSESSDTRDPPRGLALGRVELACFAGRLPAQDSLAFPPQLVEWERGRGVIPPPPGLLWVQESIPWLHPMHLGRKTAQEPLIALIC